MSQTNEQRTLHLALRRRQAALEATGKATRKTFGLGKAVGLGGSVGAVWMLAISNPAMAGIVGAIALINYAAAALKETEKTGEWRPLLGHKSFSSLAMGLDKESSYSNPTKTVEDDALYLEDRDLGEWLLLRTAMEPCIRFLELYPEEHRDEVMDLAAIEAYRQYGYMFRSEPDTRHQMKVEQVGQYAFAAVRAQADFLLDNPDDLPTESPAVGAVGVNTRLGAVEVPAVTAVASQSEESTPKFVPTVETAFSKILDNPMESRAFFGAQRTGKSYFCAAATAAIAKRDNTNVFHLNLHSYGDEDSYYWLHAESIAVDMAMMDHQQAKVVVQSAARLVEKFFKTPNSILVFDEWTILGAVNSRHKDLVAVLFGFIADKIAVLTSSGKKRRQAIWAISPNFVAANLTQSAKAIKSLNLAYLSIPPGVTVNWNGQAIGCSHELFNQLNVNYTVAPLPFAGEFECERIACIDAEWIPLGEFPPLEPVSKKLDRLMEQEAIGIPSDETLSSGSDHVLVPTEEGDDTDVEKPDLPEKEIFRLAIELEEWIAQNPEVERKKIYERWNAKRKGLSRRNVWYLLTLTDE
jgi:hypothetical protein